MWGPSDGTSFPIQRSRERDQVSLARKKSYLARTKKSPRSHARAKIVWRPSDETYGRPTATRETRHTAQASHKCGVLRDASVAPERRNTLPNSTIARAVSEVKPKQGRVGTVRSLNPPRILTPTMLKPAHHPIALQQHPPPLCIRGQPTTVPFPRLEVALHARARAFGYSKAKSVWALVRVQRNAHMAPALREPLRPCCCWLPPALPNKVLYHRHSGVK